MDIQQIFENSDNISIEPDEEKHHKLKSIWHTVKEGLLLLQSIIKNPVVKVIIAAVSTAGDAIIKPKENE